MSELYTFYIDCVRDATALGKERNLEQAGVAAKPIKNEPVGMTTTAAIAAALKLQAGSLQHRVEATAATSTSVPASTQGPKPFSSLADRPLGSGLSFNGVLMPCVFQAAARGGGGNSDQ